MSYVSAERNKADFRALNGSDLVKGLVYQYILRYEALKVFCKGG